jgi:outer membrane receptor for ferrienterochelin and colicins
MAQQAAAPPAGAASAPPTQQVEVRATRESDTEQRRQSTAAKIVIGREEIDRFGDSTVGEVLKRLPGVTMRARPGAAGRPRMRGLGGGYTQILIDGQRVPPGFSLESLTPDQIERIEILRAPTAETGARAIGGTINIITREGFKRRINDLRLGVGTRTAAHARPVVDAQRQRG